MEQPVGRVPLTHISCPASFLCALPLRNTFEPITRTLWQRYLFVLLLINRVGLWTGQVKVLNYNFIDKIIKNHSDTELVFLTLPILLQYTYISIFSFNIALTRISSVSCR